MSRRQGSVMAQELIVWLDFKCGEKRRLASVSWHNATVRGGNDDCGSRRRQRHIDTSCSKRPIRPMPDLFSKTFFLILPINNPRNLSERLPPRYVGDQRLLIVLAWPSGTARK